MIHYLLLYSPRQTRLPVCLTVRWNFGRGVHAVVLLKPVF